MARANRTRCVRGLVTNGCVPGDGRRNRRRTPEHPSSLQLLREREEIEEKSLGRRVLDDDLVFSDPVGAPLLPGTVTQAFRRIAGRIGITGVRLSDLRHTHASLMLRQNVHPKVVQERLGHATIATTLDLYSHVTPGLQEAAAARFDEALAQNRVDQGLPHHDPIEVD